MREYFDGFGVPFNAVGGNHGLEGIDEFQTDEENLEAYLRIIGKETPQFKQELPGKTLLLGLSSTVFRTATYTSHEVFVDAEQVKWFEDQVAAHPAEEGWSIFCFSHAPIIGSGLRVLQENHVVNGCCWLNHNGGPGAAPQQGRKRVIFSDLSRLVSRSVFTRFDSFLDESSSLVEFSKSGPFP